MKKAIPNEKLGLTETLPNKVFSKLKRLTKVMPQLKWSQNRFCKIPTTWITKSGDINYFVISTIYFGTFNFAILEKIECI